MERYSTNLTDKQWQVIEKNINPQERKRKHSLRNIMNALLNSKLSPSGGSLKDHSPGRKTSEGSQLTMSIMPTLPKQWFNLLSVKSCLTNLLNKF